MSKAEEVGRAFAPDVEVSFNEKDGMYDAYISIGKEYYYSTDPSKKKQSVINELKGCLKKTKENIENVLEQLEKM